MKSNNNRSYILHFTVWLNIALHFGSIAFPIAFMDCINLGKSPLFGDASATLKTPGYSASLVLFKKVSLMIFLLNAINETSGEKDTFLSLLGNSIATVIRQDNNQALAEINNRLEKLQTEPLLMNKMKH